MRSKFTHCARPVRRMREGVACTLSVVSRWGYSLMTLRLELLDKAMDACSEPRRPAPRTLEFLKSDEPSRVIAPRFDEPDLVPTFAHQLFGVAEIRPGTEQFCAGCDEYELALKPIERLENSARRAHVIESSTRSRKDRWFSTLNRTSMTYTLNRGTRGQSLRYRSWDRKARSLPLNFRLAVDRTREIHTIWGPVRRKLLVAKQ
jgi:hypothetical protein